MGNRVANTNQLIRNGKYRVKIRKPKTESKLQILIGKTKKGEKQRLYKEEKEKTDQFPPEGTGGTHGSPAIHCLPVFCVPRLMKI